MVVSYSSCRGNILPWLVRRRTVLLELSSLELNYKLNFILYFNYGLLFEINMDGWMDG